MDLRGGGDWRDCVKGGLGAGWVGVIQGGGGGLDGEASA